MTNFETSALKQSRSMMRYNFVDHYCEMPAHFCTTGDPIPKDARAFPAAPGVELRKRHPCVHYDAKKGCMHPKHPKFSLAWGGKHGRT